MAGKLCFKKFLGFEFLVFNGLTMKAGHKITTQKYTKNIPYATLPATAFYS